MPGLRHVLVSFAKICAFAIFLLTVSCAQPYDPPQIFDEVFANGTTVEIPSDGFIGLKQIMERSWTSDPARLPVRVLWTHGMCTPPEGNGPDSWWQVRTRDILTAYPGAAVIPDSISQEQLPMRSILMKESLRVPGPQEPSQMMDLWFLDWTPVTAPYKPTGTHDPENPQGNPYRYARARLNNALKQGLIKDCLSDVVIYLGKNGDSIRSDTQIALCEFFGGHLDIETGCADVAVPRATVLVSESLGSSILFDGFRSLYSDYLSAREAESARISSEPVVQRHRMSPDLRAKIARTDMAVTSARTNSTNMATAMSTLTSFFMLANQIPLINLAHGPASGDPNANKALEEFLGMRPPNAPPLTIVAFGDPNDLLSFRLIPKSSHAHVVNFVVSNADTYFGYAELPTLAHCNYIRNAYVMHAIVFGYMGGIAGRSRVYDPEPCL